MPYRHWTLDDVPWDQFDRSRVNPHHLELAKAAAMVEFNSADYVAYLENVFDGDDTFLPEARRWGDEERQHGEALSRWAKLVDPDFDFDKRFQDFLDGFKIEIDVDESIRGSRAGEMVARCMVEVGTSSYYTALGDATDEPAFKFICRKIAADELRHYKLFYDNLKRYLEKDRINRLSRVRVALGRITETENDELACAYWAANNNGEPYDLDVNSRAYMSRAMAYYRDPHLDRALAMIFKECGLKPRSALFKIANRGARWMMHRQQRKLERVAA